MSLEEAKQTLRLSQTDSTHNVDLLTKIDSATEQVEQDTDRVLIYQTFELTRDTFPSNNGLIVFHQKPIASITSIKYIDTEGVEQTIDPSNYKLNEGSREVYPVNGYTWPTVSSEPYAVIIEYIAGYGLTRQEVPDLIRSAVLLQVGKWFTDPVMEWNDSSNFDGAYERIIQKILRTSYP